MRATYLASWMILCVGCSANETSGTGGGSAADVGAGGGSSTTTASTGASGGTGGSAPVCTPAQAVCDGPNAVKTCKPDGSGFETVNCAPGVMCVAGVCGCSPVGTALCQGSKIVTCGSDGVLHDDITCPPG